jgi:undecaprenyl-diphosphatase
MLEAIFLGIVQGLTEFLPISSSAHIRILGEFLPSAQDPGATFTAIMQIGTEIAVLLYFRSMIIGIMKSAFSFATRDKSTLNSPEKSDAKLALMIVVGSIPIFILGFLAQDYIRNNFRSLWLIAITLIVFGFLLGFLDHIGKREKALNDLNTSDGILYGLAQSLALIPGVSRSGATIAMGRLLKYRREDSLSYSFLLAIPAVLGSGLYELLQALDGRENVFSISETFVATGVAFVVGYAVIAWLMKFVQTKSFMPFVVYRVSLGALVLILLATGTISS